MKILFVCRGNVGRSQMSEHMFNQLIEGEHVAVSAGTLVRSKEGESRQGQKLKDLPGAEKVLVSLSDIGIDAAESQRDQLTPEMLADADAVVVMAEKDTIPDYLKDDSRAIYWDIEDPKEMDQEGTDKIREQIGGLIKEFITTL